MPVVHHFAHGPIHPIVAYVLAFFGAAISLACAARARRARSRKLRVRWLATGAFSLGSGIWLMHYTAMAAVRVQLNPDGQPVAGIDPIVLILPIMVIATAAVVGVVFGALQTITEEDFAAPAAHSRAAHRRPAALGPAQVPGSPHP